MGIKATLFDNNTGSRPELFQHLIIRILNNNNISRLIMIK